MLPPGVPDRFRFGCVSDFEYFGDPRKTADRESTVVIFGGVNVYPQETGNVPSAHPAVQDAAVFGVPDEDLGGVLTAVVVPAPQAGPGIAEELTVVLTKCH